MMDRQAQIEYLLDRAENPERYGALPEADLTVDGGNPGCADLIHLHLDFDEEDQLRMIRFEGEGCTISQASTDILLEMVEGRSLEELKALSHEELMEVLGREIVQSRVKCAMLSLDTLKVALRRYRQQKADAS